MLNILIVDDSSTMRKLIKNSIKKLGYENFLEAENGAVALELIENDDSIDCVFLDINMPVMSGFELMHQLKEKNIFDKVKIILASTEVSTLGQDYIDELNVAGVIPKPFKKHEIETILIPLLDMIENKSKVEKINFEEAILIVDDSISMRKIIKKQLLEIGCSNLLEASNGKEALERVAENMDIKLMFVDINMPIMGGVDLLLHLQKSHMLDVIKVVIISNDAKEIAKALETTKAITGIEKPFKQNYLYEVIIPILNKILNGDENFEDIKEKVCQLDSTCDIENQMEFKPDENLEEEDDKNSESEVQESEDDEKGLKLGLSVEKCVDRYLNPYGQYIIKFNNYLEQKKSLEFLSMKRFIITAYNHLMEIDIELKMGAVFDSKKDLFHTEKVYLDLMKKKSNPKEIAFELVFLNQQKDYVLFKKKLEDLKNLQSLNKSMATSLHSDLKNRKEKIKNISDKSSKVYKDEVIDYKAKNKAYADALYKASALKEEISEIYSFIEEFKETYLGHFEIAYFIKIKKQANDLISILNSKCYEFDDILWSRAKSSMSIRKFFENSEIKGSFSSQTFLEYFLKSVDRAKANTENKKLFELLDYLKKENNKTITVITEDTGEVMQMKNIIEEVDKSYKIQAFTSSAKFLEKPLEQNLIILDYEMKNLNLDKILKLYKDKSNFLLIFRKNSKSLIFEAMDSGILNATIKNYLVKPNNLNPKELSKKVISLL